MKLKNLFFLVLIVMFTRGATKKYLFSPPTPFAYDEPDYVANSVLLSKFQFGINTDSTVWSQRWAYDQPHLYHFLSGLFLESKYQLPIDIIVSQNQLDQRDPYESSSIIFGKAGDNKTLSDPVIIKHRKAYQTILIARELSFYFYLAGGIILISIIYFFCHPILAVLISVLYLNNYFYSISILAQADSLLILLILVNILLSIGYIRLSKHRLAIATALGISCGLAMSTKLNGGLTMVSSLLSIFTVFHFQSKRNLSTLLSHILLVIFWTYAIFYWLNPYLYSSPIQNTLNIFQYRIKMGLNSQAILTKQAFPMGLVNKTIIIFKNLYHQIGQTQTFSMVFSILSSILSISLISLIFIKKIVVKPETIFLLTASTYSFFLILIYIPMNWPRYYYPAIIENLLMTASTIGILFSKKKRIYRYLKQIKY